MKRVIKIKTALCVCLIASGVTLFGQESCWWLSYWTCPDTVTLGDGTQCTVDAQSECHQASLTQTDGQGGGHTSPVGETFTCCTYECSGVTTKMYEGSTPDPDAPSCGTPP